MRGASPAARRGSGLDVEIGELLVVSTRQLVASSDEPFELRELRRTERALHVG